MDVLYCSLALLIPLLGSATSDRLDCAYKLILVLQTTLNQPPWTTFDIQALFSPRVILEVIYIGVV